MADLKTWKREWVRKYRAKSPLRFKAQEAVRAAIRRGEIVKQPCEMCGALHDVQAHHPNGYDEPNWLVIQWLCRTCHNKTHGKLGGFITEDRSNVNSEQET